MLLKSATTVLASAGLMAVMIGTPTAQAAQERPTSSASATSVTGECAAQGYSVVLSASGTPIACDYANFVGDIPEGITFGCVLQASALIAGVAYWPVGIGARVTYAFTNGVTGIGVVSAC